MIAIQQDPLNPDRLILTATVTLYLEQVMLRSLLSEIGDRIRFQARKDLKSNPEVKRKIAEAATTKLLKMLGVESIEEEPKNEEKQPETVQFEVAP